MSDSATKINGNDELPVNGSVEPPVCTVVTVEPVAVTTSISTVCVAGCSFASVPVISMVCTPTVVLAGIVMVFENVPSSPVVADPSDTGVECNVMSTGVSGNQPPSVNTSEPPGPTELVLTCGGASVVVVVEPSPPIVVLVDGTVVVLVDVAGTVVVLVDVVVDVLVLVLVEVLVEVAGTVVVLVEVAGTVVVLVEVAGTVVVLVEVEVDVLVLVDVEVLVLVEVDVLVEVAGELKIACAAGGGVILIAVPVCATKPPVALISAVAAPVAGGAGNTGAVVPTTPVCAGPGWEASAQPVWMQAG